MFKRSFYALLALKFLLIPTSVISEELAPDLISDPPVTETSVMVEPATSVSAVSNWPVVLLTLVFIVLMIVFLGWVARRFSGMGTTGGSQMRVLSAIPVGTRERIALIDVHGKQLVVGVTQHNINLLHAFDEPVAPSEQDPSSDFSKKLNSLLSGQKDASR